jgi:carboxymethylenebutenolidase
VPQNCWQIFKGCVDYLKSLPQVAPNFGCIGFCFGGHVAYLAATLPDIAVTASFYGRGITTFSPGGGEPTVSQTGSIAGTIYMFFGMDDASIPPEHAEHGFGCDLRASYNPTAAEDAWQHVEELFQQLATVLSHSSSCAASD